jgi:hypothetical protein
MSDTTIEKPILNLTTCDGNAMFIIGRATKTARNAGWSNERIDKMVEDAMSGDYDHVLQTMFKNFEVV